MHREVFWLCVMLMLFSAMMLPAAAQAAARCVATYASGQQATTDDVILDYSGFGHDARLADGARLQAGLLDLAKGHLRMPSGRELFGPRATRGAVAFWVRPAFDPTAVEYAILFYCMQTDGNSLPDGYDEIGIYVDNKQLAARVVGPDSTMPFARRPVAGGLAEGKWTHVALSWRPGVREFYVDGALAVRREAPYEATRLDDFPAELGRHVSSKGWRAPGTYSRVTLYDDALTADEVMVLAAERPEPPATEPPRALFASCEWGRPWLGQNKVAAELRNLGQQPLDLRVILELSAGPQFERKQAGAQNVRLAPGAEQPIELAYELASDGPVMMALLATDAATGRLLAGRNCHAYIPPLLASLDEQGRVLAELSTAPNLSADLKQRLADAQQQLDQVREEFLAGPSAAGKEGEARLEELRAQLASIEQETARLASLGRIRAAAPGEPFVLGWTHGTIKVLKQDPFPGRLEEPIVLEAARGEYEPAQLFLFATTQPLEGVKVELSDLHGPGGTSIGRECLSWRLVGYAVTTKPTYRVDYVGEWPDPLYTVDEFAVPAGEHQIAWLTAFVPRDARAGDYSGQVTVTTSVGRRSLPLHLHVWDFDLPERSSLPTMYGLNCCGRWQSSMDVDKYARNAAEHRVSLGFPGILWRGPKVQPPSFNWSGHGQVTFVVRGEGAGLDTGALYLVCEAERGNRATYGPFVLSAEARDFSANLREPRVFRSARFEWRGTGPVRIEIGPMKLSDGETERLFDDFAQTGWWLPAGSASEASVQGGKLVLGVKAPENPSRPYESWPAAERLASASHADTDWIIDFSEFDAAVEKYYPWAANVIWVPLPGVPREATLEEARKIIAESGLVRLAAEYEKHLRDKGWLDVAYTYLWDEPEGKQYPVVDLLTHTVKEAAPGLRNMMTARGFPPTLAAVDIWCPEVYSFDPEGAERERAAGKTLWWYVAFSCRHPYPNFWIDYPALDCRVVTWLTWKHRIQGFLYWSISNWTNTQDPLREQTFPGANGDGTLVYPGDDGGPIDTVRWENIREGLEDYEYFVLLRQRVEQAAGKADPKVIELARRLLTIDDALVKDYANWSADPEAYLAARREMAKTIEELG